MPPTPKRIEERRRRNIVPGETTISLAEPVIAPALPSGMHAVAIAWYESLKVSGQSQFFEPSDWAAAIYVATAMTKNLKQPRFSAQLFGTVWAAMGDLLTTESERRRARLQVQRDLEVKKPAKPTALDEYRKVIG